MRSKELKSKTRPETEYDADWDAMVKRVGKKAKEGPRKTVWDPEKRVYKTVPVKDVKEATDPVSIPEQGVAEGGFDNASPMTKDSVKQDKISSLKNLIAIAKEQGRQLRVQELELELKKLQDVAEGITPETIHKLADRENVKWDNDPAFLALTKRLTGKEHLDDLDQEELQRVKQHLEKSPSEKKSSTSTLESTLEGLSPDALATLSKAKEKIKQDSQEELRKWEADFYANNRMPQQATPTTQVQPKPQLQPQKVDTPIAIKSKLSNKQKLALIDQITKIAKDGEKWIDRYEEILPPELKSDFQELDVMIHSEQPDYEEILKIYNRFYSGLRNFAQQKRRANSKQIAASRRELQRPSKVVYRKPEEIAEVKVEPVAPSLRTQPTKTQPKNDVYVAPEKKTTPAVVNHIKTKKVSEGEVTEEMIAKRLSKELNLFKQGQKSDKELSTKPKDKAVHKKVKDIAEGVPIEFMTDAQFYRELLSILVAIGSGALFVTYEKIKNIIQRYSAKKIITSLESRGIKGLNDQQKKHLSTLITQYKSAYKKKDGESAKRVAKEIQSYAKDNNK